jgi:hypothetical protein
MKVLLKLFLPLIFILAPVFSQSAHSNLKDPELTKRFKMISEEVMCVCGCNEPLEYCNHMKCIAWGIRGVIDELLLAQKSDEFIISGFINGYGEMVDSSPVFEIIRTDYSEYLEKFRTGFGEQYRSYPAKRNPQIMIIVILFIAAGSVGIFIKKRLKKINSSNDKKPPSSGNKSETDKLYKSLYD